MEKGLPRLSVLQYDIQRDWQEACPGQLFWFTLMNICITDRNISYSYKIYLNTYLVSRLLCGVVSSSLCYHILRRPYQALVLLTDLDPTAVFVPVAYFFDTFCIYKHVLFLVCCVALFLLHFVITYFDARIKLWSYWSTLIQHQYLLVPVAYFFFNTVLLLSLQEDPILRIVGSHAGVIDTIIPWALLPSFEYLLQGLIRCTRELLSPDWDFRLFNQDENTLR